MWTFLLLSISKFSRRNHDNKHFIIVYFQAFEEESHEKVKVETRWLFYVTRGAGLNSSNKSDTELLLSFPTIITA